MARKLAALFVLLGCLHPAATMALGLGELTLHSYLNEPLQAELSLLNTGDLHEDQIRIRLATREDFKKMGVDRAYFLTSIKFDVKIDASGRGRVLLTSEEAVLEPYLDFLIEARWPSGRLLREYTVLIDPPVFDDSAPVLSATEQVKLQEAPAEPPPAKKKPPEPERVQTGTHVDIRKSDLAPGDMPSRPYTSGTADAPTPGARYLIRRDDTLWEIAREARPEGASVHQTMLDIQRLNPHAFIDGNINRIKAGYILYLPSSKEISSHDQAQALENVRQQNDDWRAGRVSTPAYGAGPSIRISADVEEQEQAPEAVAETTGALVAEPAADEEQAPERGREPETVGPESSELQERLAAIEEQLSALQQVIAIKDQQIAELQDALARAERDRGADTGEAELEDADMQPTAAGEPGIAKAAEPARPVKEAKSAKPVKKMPQSTGLSRSHIFYGLSALLLLLLFLELVRRRRAGRGQAASRAAPEQARRIAREPLSPVEPAPAPEPEPVEKPGVAAYGEAAGHALAPDEEEEDPLADAEVYISYGRYAQAIGLLKGALADDPDNGAYRLKLLEAYVAAGDRDEAESLFAEMRRSGDATLVSRGAAILASGAAVQAAGEVPDLEIVMDEAREPEQEDLLVAADSNGYSTKLDLARAYIDMGDEDGARQLLEEIVVEAPGAIQAEAKALLNRIG